MYMVCYSGKCRILAVDAINRSWGTEYTEARKGATLDVGGLTPWRARVPLHGALLNNSESVDDYT